MRRAAAVLAYTVTACTMMPLNKLVMLQMRRAPLTAVAGQMLGAAALLVACVRRRPVVGAAELRPLLALPPVFAVMLTTSMLSLRYASLGAIMAVRNTAPLLALPAEHLWVEPQTVTWQTVGALLCVVGGCVGYVAHDVQSTPLGIALASVNTLFGVLDRLLQRHLLTTTEVAKTTLLLVNNAAGGLLVAALALAAREPVVAAAAAELRTAPLPWGASVVVGLLLGYSGAAAQAHVSATSYLVITNVNRLLTLAIGAWALGEAPTWQSLVAGGVSVGGTAWYARPAC